MQNTLIKLAENLAGPKTEINQKVELSLKLQTLFERDDEYEPIPVTTSLSCKYLCKISNLL